MIRSIFILGMLLTASYAQAQQPVKISLAKPVTTPATKEQQLRWPASDMATKGLGFFCRQELKLDKQTLVPLRFRLGSMQQTDWLESKPNAIRPQQ